MPLFFLGLPLKSISNFIQACILGGQKRADLLQKLQMLVYDTNTCVIENILWSPYLLKKKTSGNAVDGKIQSTSIKMSPKLYIQFYMVA